MDYLDFDRFQSLIKISGTLETLTSLHIGGIADFSDEGAVITIDQEGKKVPYIPGSSLKGVLRSLAESWLRSSEQICTPTHLCNSEKEKGDYCTICGLFGGFSLASHIRILDCHPKGSVCINQKKGGATNRVLGSAHDNQLKDV